MPLILAYSVLDVFAERPLEGNPLAVFHDARGLTDEQLQALARETNLSETTFVLPADDPEQERTHGVRVRIFTTEEELPFAGHPTLGTASWLWLHHPTLKGAETITLRLNVGPIVVRFTTSDSGVLATMQQNDPVFGAEHDAAEIAAVIGMQTEDLLLELRSADGLHGQRLLHRRTTFGGGAEPPCYPATRGDSVAALSWHALVLLYRSCR